MLNPDFAPDGYNLATLLARLWIGGIFFAHGYRHLKAVRSGPGMANWFESLGLRNGRLQAISAYPDGTPNAYRIVDPRQFILTATFDL